MFRLKESMEQVTIRNQANCFDVSVAAYLLNPLKNNYTWEDVAREHLGLMIDEKIDQDMKACYESYVNYASVEVDVYKRQIMQKMERFRYFRLERSVLKRQKHRKDIHWTERI